MLGEIFKNISPNFIYRLQITHFENLTDYFQGLYKLKMLF